MHLSVIGVGVGVGVGYGVWVWVWVWVGSRASSNEPAPEWLPRLKSSQVLHALRLAEIYLRTVRSTVCFFAFLGPSFSTTLLPLSTVESCSSFLSPVADLQPTLVRFSE